MRCDPSARHGRISGRFISGVIVVNTVIDLKNGDASTVQYRLDDGKLQDDLADVLRAEVLAFHNPQLHALAHTNDRMPLCSPSMETAEEFTAKHVG